MRKFWAWFGALCWIVPAFLFLECSLRPVAEPDLFFYFALVEKYLATGHWPVEDPFLFTLPHDKIMTLHLWLGYWLYYLPYRAFGWAGLILFKTLCASLMFLLPLIPLWRARRSWPVYFPLLWTLAICSAHHRFRERVSLFGDLIVLLLCSGLIYCREKRAFWYALPVLFLLWAQLHPSFPLGWAILGAFFALRPPREWKRYELICAALCLIAPALNPTGVEGWLYPLRFARDVEPDLERFVVEWLPLTDARLYVFRFLYFPFVFMFPLGLAMLARDWRSARLFEWFLLALATALALKSVRFGLMAQGIYLTLIVHAELRRPLLRESWRWLALPFLIGAIATTVYKTNLSSRWSLNLSERFYVDTNYFPENAVARLELAKPKMNIFNSFGYGGYLSWRWQGNPRVFFHGFSTNFKFYEQYYNHPQESIEAFNDMTRKFDIGVFLISKLGNDQAYINILSQHRDWQLIYQDNAAIIYAKRDPRVFQ